MNRRKMFGILAAPVAAANIPVKSEIKTDLKPYSAFNYNTIRGAWGAEYIRRTLGADSYSQIYSSQALFGDNPLCYSCPDGSGYVTKPQLDQAFADACLNGEVPGVWWE